MERCAVRRHLASLILSLSLTTLALPGAARAAEPARPNIVFILIDDLGRNDLGCYGSKFCRTPHLDRVAKEGMRFKTCRRGDGPAHNNAQAGCRLTNPAA